MVKKYKQNKQTKKSATESACTALVYVNVDFIFLQLMYVRRSFLKILYTGGRSLTNRVQLVPVVLVTFCFCFFFYLSLSYIFFNFFYLAHVVVCAGDPMNVRRHRVTDKQIVHTLLLVLLQLLVRHGERECERGQRERAWP